MMILTKLILIGSVIGFVTALSIQNRQEDTKDWYETAIFYQIYPRSFKDSNGDGIGDIQGIISKLDHLANLGITGTWLSPIFTSPMADFGYDIANFTEVDPVFGTMADLELLFTEAARRNIRIILDFVPNHSSDQCEWFIKSVNRDPEYVDYYVWHDGIWNGTHQVVPNNWQSVFYGPAWTWNDQRQQFYLHQFTKEQPDLNYRNPRVVQAMKDVLTFWLDKGASGFRVDAINHLFEVTDFRDEHLTGNDDPYSYGYTHHDFTKDLDETYEMIYEWRELMDEYQQRNGGETRIIMSEAYANATFTMKYYQSADGRQGSHMPFNFVLISDLSGDSNATDFLNVIQSRLNVIPDGRVTNWVIGNHDQPRVGSRYGIEKIDALLTLVMTLPGIAVTYNGEEIGMVDNRDGISWAETVDPQACNLDENSYREASRDPVRTPFQWDATPWAGFSTVRPWLPVHPNYLTLNLDLQTVQERSTYKYYLELSALRNHNTIKNGDFTAAVVNDNVLTYVRSHDNSTTLVILINFGDTTEIIDVSALTSDFGDNVEVLVAGAKSSHEARHKLPTNAVELSGYDAIVIGNSAISITISFAVTLMVIINIITRFY